MTAMAASLHIALTFDDNFWAPAFATMRSICLASLRPDDLHFHLIHIGLNDGHRRALDAIATEFPATLHYLDLTDHEAYRDFVRQLPIAPPFTPIIYARLLLDRLLPDAERIVYLDCDTYVRGPIEQLAETDLAGKAIGAILDPHRHRAMLGRDFRQNRDLFDFHFRYFNSGVLVIDRARYGAAGLTEMALNLSASGALKRIQYDQAILNLALRDNWLPLDPMWNLMSPTPAHEALEPNLLHYTGYRKPWTLMSQAAFAQAYRHTMTNDVFYAFWRERLQRRLKPFQRFRKSA